MKYTDEERLAIGREIYTHELTIYEASNKYQINYYTARDYMRLYRDKNNLPPMADEKNQTNTVAKKQEAKRKK